MVKGVAQESQQHNQYNRGNIECSEFGAKFADATYGRAAQAIERVHDRADILLATVHDMHRNKSGKYDPCDNRIGVKINERDEQVDKGIKHFIPYNATPLYIKYLIGQ